MKTRCPGCQTIFRVTPEQLKARAGRVRCGQCQTVFNALDSLLDESSALTPSAPAAAPPIPETAETPEIDTTPETTSLSSFELPEIEHIDIFDAPLEMDGEAHDFPPATEIPRQAAVTEEAFALSEPAVQELGKAAGLILPRETAEIPGYSKWAEDVISAPFSLPDEKTARWPFVLAAVLLLLTLAGQLLFRFRSEVAITAPSLRPVLEAFSQALNVDLPLPRHVELVSIEASDLQNDAARGNLLVLNATLRNRANYGQAYPSLELSLTDTADAAIARRVFPPSEYLSPKTPADQPFKANSDLAVRLWIEARDISAAGYRLYVFYP